MDHFLQYFFQDVGLLFRAFLEILGSAFTFLNYLLNIPLRYEIIQSYAEDFTIAEWVMVVITEIVLIAIVVLLLIGVFKLLKKLFPFVVSARKYEDMTKKMKEIQRDLIRANYEKDRLLQMKVAELGVPQEDIEAALRGEEKSESGENYSGNRNTMDSPPVDPAESRFFRLTSVDNFYKTEYMAPEYEEGFTLSEFCERFRKYSASQLRLYYDIDMMRYFIASRGTARIIILQGMSGTGKTSLPYAFGKFVNIDSTVVSVQPSWRERTELYGYFNEFTRKYTETDFLRAIYESNFYRDPHIVILDEMNIARVEYYFAEMLSILEMPRKEEWKIDIVTDVWDNDPVLINKGSIQISDNVWFVGTINNDDSTFAVADKVYDRAIPIDLDSRADAFECEKTDSIHVSTEYLNKLFDEAKASYQISQEMLDKLEELNAYVIKTFRLAFGNRIMKQIRDYVPCFIACGGTEIKAVDFIVAKKVLRKFESLSLGFMKDDLTKFSAYLDRLFGKNHMSVCKEYIELLKKTN